jgi:hypothetical protein
MDHIFALIQAGVVVNTVVANIVDPQDPNYIWVDITNIFPQPCIGWSYDGKSFTAPPLPIQASVHPQSQIILDALNTQQISLLVLNPGALVFNADTHSMQICDGSSWNVININAQPSS